MPLHYKVKRDVRKEKEPHRWLCGFAQGKHTAANRRPSFLPTFHFCAKADSPSVDYSTKLPALPLEHK